MERQFGFCLSANADRCARSRFSIETFATDLAVAGLTGARFATTYVDGSDVNARLREPSTSFPNEIAVGSGGATSPQIATLKNGNFAIVYDDASFNGTAGIGLKIFDVNGVDQTPSGPIRVDLDLAADELNPEIAVLDNGFILVTWSHVVGAGDRDIYGRLFDQAGNAIQIGGQDRFTIDGTLNDETQSSVAALLNGQFVTTWTDTESDGSGDRISGRVQELVRTIIGDGGDNILDGDALRDIMVGLGGNDFYFVDNAVDDITEVAGEGTFDRVFTSVDYQLAAGADIEGLATNDHFGTAAINLTGNAIANLIHGNMGDNIIDGRGGADTMVGRGGNDCYFVDNAGDDITEAAGEGTFDRIFTSIDYGLAAGASRRACNDRSFRHGGDRPDRQRDRQSHPRQHGRQHHRRPRRR